METKKILITFDYELFLGERSGHPAECVINPSDQIISVLEKYDVKGIFFVDTLYLYKLSLLDNEKAKEDFQKVKSQLVSFINKGHFVFPHLHPHWLDAKYIESEHQWDLSNIDKYRFSSLNAEEKEFVFSRSMDILNNILEGSDKHFEIDSYRAGGWSIQPFSDFKPYFEKYNIKNDFSVLRNSFSKTEAQQYDFLATPKNEIYLFNDDVTKENDSGHFKEFSISSIEIPEKAELINKFVLKYLWKKGDRGGFGKGKSISPKTLEPTIQYGEMVSIELLTVAKLKIYLKYIEKNNYMHFISHPKMLSDHNIKMFDKFLSSVSKKYQIESDYRAFH